MRRTDWYYGLAIVIWLIAAYFLDLIDGDLIAFALVLIPVGVFLSYMLNQDCSDIIPALGLKGGGAYVKIILTLFLTWALTDLKAKRKITHVLLLALALLVLSMFNFKTCDEQARSAFVNILQTLSLALILIAVYLYYRSGEHLTKNTFVPKSIASSA